MKQKSFLILLLTAIISFSSCSDDDDNGISGLPSIAFSTTTGEYKVKVGKEVALTATVTNAENPVYSWKLNGKIISTAPEYVFKGDKVGEYFVTLRVDADNGVAESQVKVTVAEKIAPEISMVTSLIAYSGKDAEIVANVLYIEDTKVSYVWRLNGAIVSETSSFVFNKTELGQQSLTLKVSNDDGIDFKVLTVTVLPVPLPTLYFDNGRYRVTSNEAELRQMTVPIGKSLVLSPVIANIENPRSFAWTVNGAAQGETSSLFTFTPASKGTYLITVTESGTSAKAEVSVECTEAEGTYYRAAIAGNKATAAKAFDFVPAPGQFINYQIGSTKTKALNDLQNALNSNSAPYIGAYGGYWIVGFDHSVDNVNNKADLMIKGNAFAGWSEPGIVWVMQDENGNGLPDDTWYELAGSEANKPETKTRYAITYYKPQASGSNVLWTDNLGRTGSVDYNGYHTQAYYFPMFIKEDYYTLTGTCLNSTMHIGDLETSAGYAWGYVDNFGDGSRPNYEFWIEDAMDAAGKPVKLKYIDFVKVHTGMTGKGTAVGEISTEAEIPTDLNFSK